MGPSGTIYLKPDYITRLVGPLYDERMGNRLWLQRTLRTLDGTLHDLTELAASSHLQREREASQTPRPAAEK